MTYTYLSFDDCRSFDQWLINEQELSIEKLIQKAGFLIKEWINIHISNRMLVGIIGKGNNGRDILSAFLQLSDEYDLYLYLCDESIKEGSDYQKLLKNKNITILKCIDNINTNAVIFDGIFGVGLNRELSNQMKDLITQINHLPSTVISIDVPSGLMEGKEILSIQADITLSMMFPKRVFLNSMHRKTCGDIYIMDFNLTDKQKKDYKTQPYGGHYYRL